MGYWLVDRRPAVQMTRRDARTDVVNELVLHNNGKSRNNNYLHTVLNSMIILCTKYYQKWSMSVEDIANQTRSFLSMTKKDPFSGFLIPKVVQRH